MSLDLKSVREALPGRLIHYLPTTASTMEEAARLARNGSPSGTTVVADEQTAGRGRHGRVWHSEPESGLYVSVVLLPAMRVESLPVLALALGLATAQAIKRTAGLACDLRWPNDVLIDERKVAGILVELADGAAIAGIGINVNHPSFPEGLRDEAASLRLASGRVQSREALLLALLKSVDSFSKMFFEGGPQPVIQMFSRASSYVRGKRVCVEQGDGIVVGVTAGLDSSGFLTVDKDDGSQAVIVAGGVRPVGGSHAFGS